MAQQVKVLVAKPDHPSLIPGPQWVRQGKSTPSSSFHGHEFSLSLSLSLSLSHTHTHTHTHTHGRSGEVFL